MRECIYFDAKNFIVARGISQQRKGHAKRSVFGLLPQRQSTSQG